MIRHRWPSRVAAGAAVVAAALFGGAPGWADSSTGNATIQAGALPITAAAFSAKAAPSDRVCTPLSEDVWYFETAPSSAPIAETTPPSQNPSPPQSTATSPSQQTFVSVKLTFAVPDALEPRVETIGPDGTGAASIRTPAGWTLIGATAKITTAKITTEKVTTAPTTTPNAGEGAAPNVDATEAPAGAASFVLAATCPAGTPEQMFVRVAPLATPKVKPVPRASAKTPHTTAEPASTPAGSTISQPAPAGYAPAKAAPNLPTTGLDISGMLTLGVTLFVAGVVLLIVRRQRDKPVRRSAPSDWY